MKQNLLQLLRYKAVYKLESKMRIDFINNFLQQHQSKVEEKATAV